MIKVKELMNLAWKIAKKGATKHGGSPIEYLSDALKAAWQIRGKDVKREAKTARVTVRVEKGYFKKSWVARITGTDPQYRYTRKFMDTTSQDGSVCHYDLVDGIYDVNDAGDRYYIRVSSGKIEQISEQVVAEVFPQ